MTDANCPTIWVEPGIYHEHLIVGTDKRIASSERASRVMLDGDQAGPVVSIATGAHVELRGLVITGGRAVCPDSNRNSKPPSDANLCKGGGILCLGSLVLDDSLVENNLVMVSAAAEALDLPAALGGGVYLENGSLVLQHGSFVSGNRAFCEGSSLLDASCIARGGGVFAAGTVVEVDASSGLVQNTAGISLGASIAEGGGIFLEDAALTLSGTLVDNIVSSASGEARGGGLGARGKTELSFATGARITNNLAEIQDSSLGRAMGGGIFVTGPGLSLTATRTLIEGNRARDLGGGVSAVGASVESGDMKLIFREARFNANTASKGGGLALTAIGGSGESHAEADLIDSAGVSNSAIEGGFAYLQAEEDRSTVELLLTNSTLSENFTNARSGSLPGRGSALFLSPDDDDLARATVSLSNVTIANNGEFRSNASVIALEGGSRLVARNTIFVHPSESGAACDIDEGAVFESQGYNLYDPAQCSLTGATTLDVHATNILLGEPSIDGGFAETLALLRGSPAIDAGDPSGCRDSSGTKLDRDQRHFPRDDRCDIGAYEFVK